jgi:hypothetical protein
MCMNITLQKGVAIFAPPKGVAYWHLIHHFYFLQSINIIPWEGNKT